MHEADSQGDHEVVARSFVVTLLGLGLALLGACEMRAPSEHVTKHPSAVGPRPGADGDGPVDEGFDPTSDAGGGIDAGGDGPSCGDPPATDTPFSKRALLTSVARCTAIELCELEALTKDLVAAGDAYGKSADDDSLLAFKNAWYFALQRAQRAELFGFGPGASTMEPGGKGLRDRIYAFPLISRCKTEELIVSEAYEGGDLESAPYNAVGLGALEYLLFYTGTDNACNGLSPVNIGGKWGKIPPAELAERKVALASVIARDVHDVAQKLADAWDPSHGNFTAELAKAGRGSTVFATEQQALNAVSNALFYVEHEVKVLKLAEPAGLGTCTSGCTSLVESRYARVSGDNLRANLRAFRLLFQGCGADNKGLGFDDWLRAVGMGSLADDMLAALDGADAAAADFDLDKALASDPSQVVPVHAAVKKLADLLKTEFVSVLDLELPMSAEGDND